MTEITKGIIGIILICLCFIVETILFDLIYKYLEYQKMSKSDFTNLSYKEFIELKKKINKIYHLSYFQIVYAKEKVVIKIKKNYFDFGTEDSSLTMLFSEDNMFKMQISK